MATTTVEVKFDGSTWIDITSYLRSVRVGRGRANDLSTVDPGTLMVELDNADGRFTPTNTQGAYHPDVKPAVPVRVTVNGGAGPSDFRLFTGEAQRWEPQWTVGGRPVVVLEAVDGFEQLANFEIEYAHWHYIRSTTPDAYWPLSETGTTLLDESGGGRHLQVQPHASAELGASSLVTGGDGSIKLASTDFATQLDGQPVEWFGASGDVTFSGWVRFDVLDIGDVVVAAASGSLFGSNGIGWTFKVGSSGRLELQFRNAASIDTLQSPALSWSEDTTYQVGFWWDLSALEVTFYRNGVSVGSDTTALTPAETDHTRRFEVGAIGDNFGGPSPVDEVRVADVAIWPSDQSALMPDLHTSGQGFASDLPGVRIGRVLDWAGWPAGDRDLDDGTTPLAAVESGTALAACQDAGAADGGVFYIDADGDATFQGRRTRWQEGLDYSDVYIDTYGGTVVDFDDDGTDTGYQTVGWRYDTTLMANQVKIDSNTQGTSDGVAEDTTSQDDFGLRTLTISTISNNTADNAERADWELSRRKDPHLRLEQVSFLVADTVQEDAAGTLELQSLVEVNRRPGSGQDDLTVLMRVASIDHRLEDGGHRWEATFGLLDADTDQPGIYGTAVYGTDYYGY